MAGSSILHVNEQNWKQEVLESATPVLVDFWAEWCGPCRVLGRTLEELAPELAGKMKLVKVDIDKNQQLAAQFSIRSVPTLLVFHGGTVRGQMVGAIGKAELKQKLATHLA